jgi:hypothetical protein
MEQHHHQENGAAPSAPWNSIITTPTISIMEQHHYQHHGAASSASWSSTISSTTISTIPPPSVAATKHNEEQRINTNQCEGQQREQLCSNNNNNNNNVISRCNNTITCKTLCQPYILGTKCLGLVLHFGLDLFLDFSFMGRSYVCITYASICFCS